MQKTISTIVVALIAAAGMLAALINPLVVLTASISIIAFLSITRQTNLLSKALLLMKNYAKNISRLRIEIHAKLHTGFCDFNTSIDAEESNRRSSGFVR